MVGEVCTWTRQFTASTSGEDHIGAIQLLGMSVGEWPTVVVAPHEP